MADLNIAKNHIEDPRPLLSLKSQDDKKCDKKNNEEEQEALWSRSLEFFQSMDVNSKSC